MPGLTFVPQLRIRERLDRHPVRGLAHAELVGPAERAGQLDRRAAAALDPQPHLRDRAVEGVVLAAGGVGVAEGDGLAGRSLDRDADRRARAADDRVERPRAGVDPGRADAADAAEPDAARRPARGRRWRPKASVGRRPSAARSTTSSHAPGASAKPTACSQTQRSACSEPQLWPTMPRQPATSVRCPSASIQPVNTASGCGLSSFVRGSGARYIHARGRWRSAGSPPAACRSHGGAERPWRRRRRRPVASPPSGGVGAAAARAATA